MIQRSMSCVSAQRHDVLHVSHPMCQNMCSSRGTAGSSTRAMGYNSVNSRTKLTSSTMAPTHFHEVIEDVFLCNQSRLCSPSVCGITGATLLQHMHCCRRRPITRILLAKGPTSPRVGTCVPHREPSARRSPWWKCRVGRLQRS